MDIVSGGDLPEPTQGRVSPVPIDVAGIISLLRHLAAHLEQPGPLEGHIDYVIQQPETVDDEPKATIRAIWRWTDPDGLTQTKYIGSRTTP
jgi:hypothetical protein